MTATPRPDGLYPIGSLGFPAETESDGIIRVHTLPNPDATRPERTLYVAVDGGQRYVRSTANPHLLVRDDGDGPR